MAFFVDTRSLMSSPFSSPFRFQLLCTDPSGARRGRIQTAHGTVETPCFMPVGTLANVKTQTWDDLRSLGAQMVLANTYHLYLRPGHELIEQMGGFHRFTSWDRAVLTDSGGFQVYSLAAHRKIKDDGVQFRSHLDGSSHFFTPELVMGIQAALGVDVAMAFDECCPYPSTREYAARSMVRTHQWAERSWKAWPVEHHGVPYGICQGAFEEDLRVESAQAIAAMPFAGVAVGGLAVGEPKPVFWRMLDVVMPHLPAQRPRYLMGVGYPDDLVEAVARGVDQFDCVLPTRNARKAMLFTSRGPLIAKAARYARDQGPPDPECTCRVCSTTSRAYLRHLFKAQEYLAQHLATYHNLYFYQDLMRRMRTAIEMGEYAEFRREFHARYDPAAR